MGVFNRSVRARGSNTPRIITSSTAGAWSRQLLGNHALKLDIWPVRGQILLFKVQPDLLKTIVLRDRDYFYLIPRRDGHILAGSTLEEAGFDKDSYRRSAQNIAGKRACARARVDGRNRCRPLGRIAPGVARQYTCHRSPSFNP